MAGTIDATSGRRGCFGKVMHPIGTIRFTGKGGVPMMKVAARPTKSGNKDNWRPANRVIWEREHGEPVPDGCVVVFCDHDVTNLSPDNLLCVPRRYLGQMNNVDGWCDMATAKAALELAMLRCAIADRTEGAPLRCKRCGASFMPHGMTARYGTRKLCPDCLGSFLAEHGRRR